MPAPDAGEAISIEAAEKEFLADCESRKLKKSTVGRYRILFRELDAFAAKEGFRFLKQLDIPALNRFRATWKGESGLTDLKKLERLRSFFKFALANGYVQQNPAAAIRNPKIRPNPTLPFSQEEMLEDPRRGGKENHGCEAGREKQSSPAASADPAPALCGTADLRRHRMRSRSPAGREAFSLHAKNRAARLLPAAGVRRGRARERATREQSLLVLDRRRHDRDGEKKMERGARGSVR